MTTISVIIPSYNTGAARLLETVRQALGQWSPVWVVIDGSDDGSEEPLLALREETRAGELRVFQYSKNRGKGAAIFHALRAAANEGFTHFLAMDSDGQHTVAMLDSLLALSGTSEMVVGQRQGLIQRALRRGSRRGRSYRYQSQQDDHQQSCVFNLHLASPG